jgi:hypothetical protein
MTKFEKITNEINSEININATLDGLWAKEMRIEKKINEAMREDAVGFIRFLTTNRKPCEYMTIHHWNVLYMDGDVGDTFSTSFLIDTFWDDMDRETVEFLQGEIDNE